MGSVSAWSARLVERLGRRLARCCLLAPKVALGADEVPKAKPAADGLLQCCEKLGVKAGDAVYIGDSPSDGRAARAAGMRSIGVTWGANSRDVLDGQFDVLADDVRGLSKALQGFLLPPKEERVSM